jgi:heptosyltransferase-2
MANQTINSPKIERLLVRGVNWLGDAIMTMPALQQVRAAFPKARITILTHEKLAEIYAGYEAVDEVLAFKAGEKPWSIGRRLRPLDFDTALILPNSPRAAVEAWCAGIPARVGYSGAFRSVLLTKNLERRQSVVRMRKRSVSEVRELVATNPDAPRFRYPESAHQMHDYLTLAGAIGASTQPVAPRLYVAAAEVSQVLAKFGLSNGSGQPLFGLNPAAEYGPAKCWPLERFAAVAVELHKRTNCRWLVFGTAGQREIAESLVREIGSGRLAVNLTGQTTLRELRALLKACRLLLTNDSGPMHLAAALGTRIIAPFGSTSPELTGPITKGNLAHVIVGQAPCAPCFLRECPIDFRCMKSIGVAEVIEKADLLLSDAASP